VAWRPINRQPRQVNHHRLRGASPGRRLSSFGKRIREKYAASVAGPRDPTAETRGSSQRGVFHRNGGRSKIKSKTPTRPGQTWLQDHPENHAQPTTTSAPKYCSGPTPNHRLPFPILSSRQALGDSQNPAISKAVYVQWELRLLGLRSKRFLHCQSGEPEGTLHCRCSHSPEGSRISAGWGLHLILCSSGTGMSILESLESTLRTYSPSGTSCSRR
jgi:hypothetical protein